MRYMLKETSNVCGGHIDLELRPMGQIYDAHYEVFVKIGKRIFGKFIGSNQEFSGSYRIHQNTLSEAFIKNTKEFEIEGVKFTKQGDSKYLSVFTFSSGDVKGKIDFWRDGKDPVDIKKIYASAPIVGEVEAERI